MTGSDATSPTCFCVFLDFYIKYFNKNQFMCFNNNLRVFVFSLDGCTWSKHAVRRNNLTVNSYLYMLMRRLSFHRIYAYPMKDTRKLQPYKRKRDPFFPW
jgi:hypothetical protein